MGRLCFWSLKSDGLTQIRHELSWYCALSDVSYVTGRPPSVNRFCAVKNKGQSQKAEGRMSTTLAPSFQCLRFLVIFIDFLSDRLVHHTLYEAIEVRFTNLGSI